MKIEYINHACLLIKTKNNKKILTDPWLHGPSWGNNLWIFPKSKHTSDYFSDIDYIYMSHGHEDHLHKKSIDWLPEHIKEVPVISPDFGAKYLINTYKKYGFSNLVMLKDNESIEIDNNIRITMFINHDDHDSSLLLSTDNTNVFFQTDNLMSRDDSKLIAHNHDINLCFTMTSRTGPFPGFYKMNEDDMNKAVIQKREDSKIISFNLVSDLKPKYIVPYASDVCYFNEDFYANSLHCDDKSGYKNLVELNMPHSEVIIMNPHDSFVIENGLIQERDIKKERVQDSLEEHYELLKDQVEAVAMERSKDNKENLAENVDILFKALSAFNDTWDEAPFNVIWKIKDSANQSIYINHKPGSNVQMTHDIDGLKYDLFIHLDLYRVKHLINNNYALGFMSLWNGGFKCSRDSLEYKPIEQNFWKWLMRKFQIT